MRLHQGGPVTRAGESLQRAGAAMVMIHGRGASASDILTLAQEFGAPGLAYLAPQAAGGQWYPNRFVAPAASNEPWLSSALAAVRDVLDAVAAAGISPERTFLLGFSQGACLALECAARGAADGRRFGGVIGLSGALIEEGDAPRAYTGAMAGTPVFLGCSDDDPHIPLARVRRSAEVLRSLGADVTTRIYPGMGHTVNADEIEFVKGLMLKTQPTERAP